MVATQLSFGAHSQSFSGVEDAEGLTPRQRVVQILLRTNEDIGSVQTRGRALITEDLKNTVAERPEDEVLLEVAGEIKLDAPSLAEPIAKEESVEAASTEMADTAPGPLEGRYGFFQTAADYLKARNMKGGQEGEPLADHLTLTYRVTRKDTKTDIALDPETVIFTLGADFAQIKRGDKPTRLYDFKLRRMLTLGDQAFSNVSLFGARYNDINTVQRMTQNGKKRDVDVRTKTLI